MGRGGSGGVHGEEMRGGVRKGVRRGGERREKVNIIISGK